MGLIDPSFRYTDDDHAHYVRDGYRILGRLLSDEGLDASLGHIDAMIERKLHPDLGPDQIISAHQQEPWLWELATQPQLLDMIEKQIGSDIVLWSSHLICKPPHSGTHVPWHQDAPYWNVSGPLAGAIWLIAFDDVDASNGAMCVLPGWHRRGALARRDTGDALFTEEIDPGELPDDLEASKVQYRFGAGVLATHDTMLPHTSEPNGSDRWRRVLVLRYMGATGEMGPSTYEDYRTREPLEREFYLVRGDGASGRGLKRSPFD